MAEGRPGGWSEFRRGWPVVAASLVGIGLGLSPVPFYTIGMLGPEQARAFHWSRGQVQFGLFLMTVAVVALSPAVGLLTDRYGVRRVALTSVVLFGLSFSAFALGDGSLARFYATWIVMGVLGAGTLPITWTRAVNNRFDRKRGAALGLSLVGTGLFGFVIKPLTAALIASVGWRGAYLAIGALPILVALPIGLFGLHDAAGAAGVGADTWRTEARERRARSPGLTFGEAVRSWRFWVLAAAFVPVSFAVGGPIPNLESILTLQGFQAADVVSLAQIVGLSVIAGRLVGGWLADRLWAPGVAFVLLSLPAFACWMLGHGPLGYGQAGFAIFLIGFAAGVEYDLMAFLTARYFGLKSYGSIYGALYGFFGLGAGLAPAVFGRAFDQLGSYTAVLTASSVALVSGAALLLTLGRYRAFPDSGAEILPAAERTVDALPI